MKIKLTSPLLTQTISQIPMFKTLYNLIIPLFHEQQKTFIKEEEKNLHFHWINYIKYPIENIIPLRSTINL